MELKEGEKFFIEVVREFDFLRKLGYVSDCFNIIGREYFVKFKNTNLSRSIIIEKSEPGELTVFIERKLLWGNDRINLKNFNKKGNFPGSIKSLSELMQLEYLDKIKGGK